MNSILSHLLADADGSFWMPEQASDYAGNVDSLFGFIFWLSAFMCGALMGTMVYFAVKYRKRSEDQRTNPVKHNLRLEFLWSAVPTVLMIVMFAWGFSDFTALSATPTDALKLRVVGKQWNWTFAYPDLGRECIPEQAEDGTMNTTFYLPVDQAFTAQLSSDDVIHSLWIPAFRVKKDALPNRYTGFTVTPTATGTFRVYCAEYCGKDHSRMTATLEVLDPTEWQEFLASDLCTEDPTAPDYGEKLFVKLGCAGCHSTTEDMSVKVGPGLYGLDAKGAEMTTDGEVPVDDAYLRESIEYPEKKIVAGFEGVNMPAFRGRVNETQIAALIKYIKDLDGGDAPEQPEKNE